MKHFYRVSIVTALCYTTCSFAQEQSALNASSMVQKTEPASETITAKSPVNLHAFRTTTGVTLNWTSIETDKKTRFFIESGIDGEHFTGNGVVNGGKQKSFEFIDLNSGNKSRFYRIRMEKDGITIATSESFLVTGAEEKPFSIYPLESDGELFADLFVDLKGQSMRVIVKDSEGGIHVSKQVPIEGNLSKIKILSGRDGLKPGVYQVSLAFKNRTFSDTVTVK